MFVVIAALCAGAFTLGGAAGIQRDSGGIPAEHPIALALRFRQELALTADQAAKLEQLRVAMAQEFAPLREQMESLQRRMEELRHSEKEDSDAAKALQQEGETLGATIKPMLVRYAQPVGEMLTPEQREKLMRLSEAHGQQGDPREFLLMFMMQAREQLGITPQQFTKLQFLQADFIRTFAPMREQMELMQMEAQKSEHQPSPERGAQEVQQAVARQRAFNMQALQIRVKGLQVQFSERAMKVLESGQRAKLAESLGGERRTGPIGR